MLTTHAGARGTKVRFFFAPSVCIFRVYRMEQSNVRHIFFGELHQRKGIKCKRNLIVIIRKFYITLIKVISISIKYQVKTKFVLEKLNHIAATKQHIYLFPSKHIFPAKDLKRHLWQNHGVFVHQVVLLINSLKFSALSCDLNENISKWSSFPHLSSKQPACCTNNIRKHEIR